LASNKHFLKNAGLAFKRGCSTMAPGEIADRSNHWSKRWM